MSRQCLLCSADKALRENIEEFIEAGHGSYVDAKAHAEKIGLKISHTSIQRHVENHTKINYINPSNNNEIVKIPLEQLDSNSENFEEKVSQNVQEILGNLSIICKNNIAQYMNGEARFPRDELRSLQSLYASHNKK